LAEIASFISLVFLVISIIFALVGAWWMYSVLAELKEINKEATQRNVLAKTQHQELLAALRSKRDTP
jgi:hypothetical protein